MFKRILYVTSVFSFSGFTLLTYIVDQRAYFFRDYQVIDYAQTFTSPFTRNVLTAVSWPGYLPQAAYFIVAFLLLLVIFGKRLEALIAAVSFPSISAFAYLVKAYVGRIRPEADIYLYSGHDRSYPSGHVVAYTVILGFMLYIASLHFKNPKIKALHAAIYLFLMFLVGFSRIYVGHHWPTDVIGGFLLGFSWLTFTILISSFFTQKTNSTP